VPPKPVTIATLNDQHLRDFPAWEWTGEYDNDGNEILVPVLLNECDAVPQSVGEAWCRCSCRFAEGSEHAASAMCRGDSALGPVGISVWNGQKHVRLILPPAPEFVLQEEGPAAFCESFGRRLEAVFPVELLVIPRFALVPQDRSVRIEQSGKVTRHMQYGPENCKGGR
jgi:hypothetical protein